MKTKKTSLKFLAYTFLVLSAILFSGIDAMAQDVSSMENFMRQSGKIYVVIAVITIIFGGIIFYLIQLDKKISSLEKKMNS